MIGRYTLHFSLEGTGEGRRRKKSRPRKKGIRVRADEPLVTVGGGKWPSP